MPSTEDFSTRTFEIFPDITFNIVYDDTGRASTNRSTLYVDSHAVDNPVEVVSLSLNGNKLFFGRQKLIPVSFLDFGKKKRSPILLSLTEVAGVKRKFPLVR